MQLSASTSGYSRDIAEENSAGNSKFSPEIWQREKYGQLIFMRIVEIVATRCQILKLKCTKFDFGWCSALDPAGGAYSVPQIP